MKTINSFLLLCFGAVISINAQHNFNNAPNLPGARNGYRWQLNERYSTDFSSFSDMDQGWVREYPRCGGGSPWTGPGQTNFTASNARLSNGKLELIATRGSGTKTDIVSGRTAPAINTGIISTRGTIKFPVYMEARIKPANMLASSNFWGINDAQNQEMDILEVYGGGEITDSYMDWFTYRAGSNFHIFKRTSTACGSGIIDDFHDQKRQTRSSRWRDAYHTFGVLWRSPTDVVYYYDGNRINETSLANSNPFIHNNDGSRGRTIGTNSGDPNKEIRDGVRMIIDLEIHDWLSFGRNSDGRDIRPNLDGYEFGGGNNIMKVDWVRVYNEVQTSGGSTGGSTGGNTSADLALGKSTFQSSTYNNNNNSFGSGKCVDGNGSSFNHTKKSNWPWWEVDLGSTQDIGNVKIWNRGSCCANRMNNFTIRVYDRRGGNQIWAKTYSNAPSTNGTDYAVNQRGRVVRIQLRGSDRILHMDQVSVFRRGGKALNTSTLPDITVYPNPVSSNNSVTIAGTNEGDIISITNSIGQLVKEITASTNSEIIETSGLTTGLYFVTVGATTTKLIIN